MPTYEYACSSCDATHEVQQKMTDPTLTTCPVCGQPGVRKLFSGVGIHFKGSGFYRTDSRDAKTGGSGDKSAGDKSSGDKSGGDKSSGDKSSGDKSSGEKTSADKGSKQSAPAAPPAPAAGTSNGSTKGSNSSSGSKSAAPSSG